MPEPRLSGSISVSFTPRVFKTAARESKAPEEEEVCTFFAIYLHHPLIKTINVSTFLFKGDGHLFFSMNLRSGIKTILFDFMGQFSDYRLQGEVQECFRLSFQKTEQRHVKAF